MQRIFSSWNKIPDTPVEPEHRNTIITHTPVEQEQSTSIEEDDDVVETIEHDGQFDDNDEVISIGSDEESVQLNELTRS